MFIEPLECPKCGGRGRPAELPFHQVASYNDTNAHIYCKCGNEFDLPEPRDQCILSTNPFCRLQAASKYGEFGNVEIIPGQLHQVKFGKRFDYLSKAYFTPQGEHLYLREYFLSNEGMLILSGVPLGTAVPTSPVRVNWSVFGLVDIHSLETWYVQFFAAMTQLENGLYKAALLDYAIAFEAFLEYWLNLHLEARYGAELSSYLLRNAWQIEQRCKDLLELAIGKRFTERDDVYQPWKRDVQEIRNRLAHGEQIDITREMAEAAHSAVYQGIRWIQSESP